VTGEAGRDPRPESPPNSVRQVEYKGAPLDAARGPGLGCFWLQVGVLLVLVVLTPLSATWNWPVAVSFGLLIAVVVLLLFVGQTIIFLLRLVAADRRAEARRRPLRSQTRTVGELEDEAHLQREPEVEPKREPETGDGPEPPAGGVRE
jgi:hypothetical protein